jgi:hypothetical protein
LDGYQTLWIIYKYRRARICRKKEEEEEVGEEVVS